MRLHLVMFEGATKRREAIEEVRAAARLGARHFPPGALTAMVDPTDTFVGELNTAFAAGTAERARKRFLAWFKANFTRLSDACANAGVRDGRKWLRQRHTEEGGKVS